MENCEAKKADEYFSFVLSKEKYQFGIYRFFVNLKMELSRDILLGPAFKKANSKQLKINFEQFCV